MKLITLSSIVDQLQDISCLAQEQLVCFSLNDANEVIIRRVISVGSFNAVFAHPREIFKAALVDGAVAVIIAHNHPSGKPWPSNQDVFLTQQLASVGLILGVPLIDHVIVSGSKSFSFKEAELL